MKRLITILLCLTHTWLSLGQTMTIRIAEHSYQIDDSLGIVISFVDSLEVYNNLDNYQEVIIALNQREYTFDSIPTALSYSESYAITNTTNQLSLYLTRLPLISIMSSDTIVDEPKIPARISYADEDQVFTSNIGIELRGGNSLYYPKKTFDLEFWKDDTGIETRDVQFGNMRSDDDWILDALYNEPLRLRSYIANTLWLDIHTPTYAVQEPNAKSGADVSYVELFVNGRYTGIYNLSEQIDRKQLQLKTYNGSIRGELYKGVSWGASTFGSLPTLQSEAQEWGGYEIKYPNEVDTSNWELLYDFTDYIINSSDTEFSNTVWERFVKENYIDYFIFLNMLRATDNTGKNIYLAKYNTNTPYFYIPWDLDGSFGLRWDGANDNVTNSILTNGFMDRVIALNPGNYRQTIAQRWSDYRTTILDTKTLLNRVISIHNMLSSNLLYARESLAHPEYISNDENLPYILTWIEQRLTYLDEYFAMTSSSIETTTDRDIIQLYPNPAREKVFIKRNDNSGIVKIKVFDLLGNILMSQEVLENYFSVESLSQETYVVFVNDYPIRLVIQ